MTLIPLNAVPIRSPFARAAGAAARVVDDAITGAQLEDAGWRAWVQHYFAELTEFAPRHERLWRWWESLAPGVTVDPLVNVWPRGGAKSSSAELGVVFVGSRPEARRRKFCLYLCGTQSQANLHVAAIAKGFQTVGRGRATGRYGTSLGWRIDTLRVDNGFNVMALGLDAAGRGIKIEMDRPDIIVLDDVDERHDTERSVRKKVATLTQTILPMGSTDVAVLVQQNRIHAASIVSQLADGKADFLHGREVVEEPAVVHDDGTAFEAGKQDWVEGTILPDGRRHYRPVRGRATWAGQNLETIESQLNTWGRVSFMRESQHDLTEAEGGMWSRERDIDPFRVDAKVVTVDDMLLVAVAVDPNASEGNDAAGVIVGGMRKVDGIPHAYVFADETTEGGPHTWAKTVVAAHIRWQSDRVVAEVNNGGDMVEITLGTVEGAPRVKKVHASRGKSTRAEPVQSVYEDGRVHHVGVFTQLESELCSWKVGDPSPNRLDALVWLITYLLRLKPKGGPRTPWFPGQGKPKSTEVEDDAATEPAGTGRPTAAERRAARAARRAARVAGGGRPPVRPAR